MHVCNDRLLAVRMVVPALFFFVSPFRQGLFGFDAQVSKKRKKERSLYDMAAR